MAERLVEVVVENPRGSRSKYEIDHTIGAIRQGRDDAWTTIEAARARLVESERR